MASVLDQANQEKNQQANNNESPNKAPVRDIKTPFTTAVADEDTPEDLEKFGVRHLIFT